MKTEESPQWVLQLFQAGIRAAGNKKKLAIILGISPSNIGNYESGQVPSATIVDNLLRYVGGDIKRALPDYNPDSEPVSMHVYGQVQAGMVEEGGQFEREIPGVSEEAWRGSSLFKLSSGRTILLEVVGDSMEPQYHEGDFIVCRSPGGHEKDIPDGTPCVFREGRGFTFKLLRWTKGKKDVVGVPINSAHKPIVFERTEDFRIKYVVLGKISLG